MSRNCKRFLSLKSENFYSNLLFCVENSDINSKIGEYQFWHKKLNSDPYINFGSKIRFLTVYQFELENHNYDLYINKGS